MNCTECGTKCVKTDPGEYECPDCCNVFKTEESSPQATRAAFARGRRDADRNRGPLFRRTARGIVAQCGDEWSEDMSDGWNDAARRAYLEGYEA
jgi:transcription initiation factor TFIIIB Brf1 subunit/transcription initiation factor TFIIB